MFTNELFSIPKLEYGHRLSLHSPPLREVPCTTGLADPYTTSASVGTVALLSKGKMDSVAEIMPNAGVDTMGLGEGTVTAAAGGPMRCLLSCPDDNTKHIKEAFAVTALKMIVTPLLSVAALGAEQRGVRAFARRVGIPDVPGIGASSASCCWCPRWRRS